jgi:hypothetical protein
MYVNASQEGSFVNAHRKERIAVWAKGGFGQREGVKMVGIIIKGTWQVMN